MLGNEFWITIPVPPSQIKSAAEDQGGKGTEKSLAKKPVRNERLQLNPSLYAMPAWEMTLDALTMSAVKCFFAAWKCPRTYDLHPPLHRGM